jgi:ABC-2 type transport system ATP-binding protein
MDPAIRTEGLVKTYRGRPALDGVSLSVARGSVFGLLGPNGAGKTTFVRLLSTLIRPDSGAAWVLGHDVLREPEAVRARISLTGQFASVDEDLTGRENLVLVGRLLGLARAGAKARAEDLLAAFDLAEAALAQVRTYSGGMRRRLDIAASMIARPAMLFLDEPTTGLDPRSRAEVWAITRRLARTGTTVLLTTQYLEEADQLAERIAVIDHGRIIAEGTSTELKARVGSGLLSLRFAEPALAYQAAAIAAGLGLASQSGDDVRRLEVPLPNAGAATRLLGALAAEGVAATEFGYGQPSLDAVFFALTGHPATEEASP